MKKDEKIIILTVECNMIDLFITNFCRQYQEDQEDQESNQKNHLFIPFLLGPPLKNEWTYFFFVFLGGGFSDNFWEICIPNIARYSMSWEMKNLIKPIWWCKGKSRDHADKVAELIVLLIISGKSRTWKQYKYKHENAEYQNIVKFFINAIFMQYVQIITQIFTQP